MTTKKRVGILTGGGDVPGLNAAIKAVAMRARDYDLEIVGLRRGWLGLLQMDPDDPASLEAWTMPLPVERVRTIDRRAGPSSTSRRTEQRQTEDACVRAPRPCCHPDGRVDARSALRVLEYLKSMPSSR
jgi:6-phosphofructokinase 1